MKNRLILFPLFVLLSVCMSCQNPGNEGQKYQGLIGGWYKSTNLKRLAEPEILENLELTQGSKSTRGGSWSAQYEGYLSAPVTDSVVFYLSSNQDVEIHLDEKELLVTREGMERDSAAFTLRKGEAYPIHVIYRQRKGKSQTVQGEPFFKVSWRSKDSEEQDVPSGALFFTEEQNHTWRYIGENYYGPFRYTDDIEYALDPIQVKAPELARLDFSLPTGGLPVVPGVETYTVCRANREQPENAEGLGYTYQHHPDMAIWRGRMYVGWNTCLVDEDTYPSRELISSSADGEHWSSPVEMFPQGISTPLRMYFYLAPNGTMLVIAGLREDRENLTERRKGGIVVRQLNPDHSLGNVYTLRNMKAPFPHQPPEYASSPDEEFVEACNQLLADTLYLSQQDYGNLLPPEQRMKWFNPDNWEGSEQLRDMASEFGKAMCFFKRKDGTLVALSKFRWVATSSDGGQTWKQPVMPKSLITGGGKVWGQATSDGRFALVYNPHPDNRWPLLILTSEDGITFSNPMSVNSTLPEMRYEGKFKDAGLSYHRGLSRWNNDGTWSDNDLWLVYSQNKEDILITRVPISKNN